ncbi:sensor histidine kinase [Thermoflavimicrobium daqui]|uniref:histidine kinase n=1 Tax=Thermoflavimicrobium daqui TaxID=2137476 RepID=A0A364K2Z9_9BACL|nr:histidine kinase [Thermoflavimicrobium daqui]RAL23212.1 two-component sensor histidine kinase [Thermoflavimicrobium daqui]
MSYKQIKALILILPTLIIGLWEYTRHAFLLPYISMDLGNWLSPLIVFLVTITILRKLFLIYEKMQVQLEQERAEKVILQERERIARELHDGIAQSLFLYSVQINQLKKQNPSFDWADLEKSLRQMHDYVRHAISNLKTPPTSDNHQWQIQVKDWINQYQLDTGLSVEVTIEYPTDSLCPKEKVELFACIQEALTNIRKHAQAKAVSLCLIPYEKGWKLEIVDDGVGFQNDPFQTMDHFGLKIMKDRAAEISASLTLQRENQQTKLAIIREGEYVSNSYRR